MQSTFQFLIGTVLLLKIEQAWYEDAIISIPYRYGITGGKMARIFSFDADFNSL